MNTRLSASCLPQGGAIWLRKRKLWLIICLWSTVLRQQAERSWNMGITGLVSLCFLTTEVCCWWKQQTNQNTIVKDTFCSSNTEKALHFNTNYLDSLAGVLMLNYKSNESTLFTAGTFSFHNSIIIITCYGSCENMEKTEWIIRQLWQVFIESNDSELVQVIFCLLLINNPLLHMFSKDYCKGFLGPM